MNASLMRTPRSVDIELTAKCNLRCRYCYFFNNPAVEYHDLPTAEWLAFFDELGSLGVMDVTLSGGEAIIRPDFRELVTAVVRNRMRFAVLSNGALIDDSLAAFLAQTGRCNYVQVSLDGARPETHDAGRGKGSFDSAVRGIRTLQRNGVKTAVRVTIHRHNYTELEETARFLLEGLGLPSFSTNSAGYLGACRIHADDMLLTTTEHQVAMETLLRLTEKYPGRITAAAGPLAEGKMWARMETARRANAPVFSTGGHLTACGCTSNKIAVRADGAIVPCSMLPHIVLGHINQDALQDIWQRHPALYDLRARRNLPLSNFEFCAGCDYQAYCTGNCPGLAYTLTGKVNHPSPDACLREFLAAGGTLSNG